MKKTVEIKWPWTMVWLEYAEEIMDQIKEALPPDHELQSHDLFPLAKWEGRPIFVVEDDTTGERIYLNFENMKRWKKAKLRVPTIKVLKDAEVTEMIERDHHAECAKYNEDGTLK
jgi:hypothetical protein